MPPPFAPDAAPVIASAMRGDFSSAVAAVLDAMPPTLRDVLSIEVLGNAAVQWLGAALIFVLLLAFLLGLRLVLSRRLTAFAAKTTNRFDDLAGELVGRTRGLVLIVVSLGAAASVLDVAPSLDRWLYGLVVVALFVQVGIWGNHVLGWGVRRWVARGTPKGTLNTALVGLLHFFGRVTVWSIVVLLALDNLGQDVTALVAGLGVGGIAIGLAMQNVLQDTLASLSIALDKPFEVGDEIAVGDLTGIVEEIGIKTTRLRSPGGEQLIFGNADLLSSRIRNLRRLTERRSLFRFGVVYSTPLDVLERIPVLVREIAESLPDVRFGRAHLVALGDSAILFEVVFFVTEPAMEVFLDRQQALHLRLLRELEALDVELAFPTQTVLFRSTGAPAEVFGKDGADAAGEAAGGAPRPVVG